VAGDLWASKEDTGVGKEDIKATPIHFSSASVTVLNHCFEPATDRDGDAELMVAQSRPPDLADGYMINVFGNQLPQRKIRLVGRRRAPRLQYMSTFAQPTHMME